MGIAHLALRTVLVAGRKGILALRPYLKKDDSGIVETAIKLINRFTEGQFAYLHQFFSEF